MLRFRYIPDRSKRSSRSQSEERPRSQPPSTPTFSDDRPHTPSSRTCFTPTFSSDDHHNDSHHNSSSSSSSAFKRFLLPLQTRTFSTPSFNDQRQFSSDRNLSVSSFKENHDLSSSKENHSVSSFKNNDNLSSFKEVQNLSYERKVFTPTFRDEQLSSDRSLPLHSFDDNRNLSSERKVFTPTFRDEQMSSDRSLPLCTFRENQSLSAERKVFTPTFRDEQLSSDRTLPMHSLKGNRNLSSERKVFIPTFGDEQSSDSTLPLRGFREKHDSSSEIVPVQNFSSDPRYSSERTLPVSGLKEDRNVFSEGNSSTHSFNDDRNLSSDRTVSTLSFKDGGQFLNKRNGSTPSLHHDHQAACERTSSIPSFRDNDGSFSPHRTLSKPAFRDDGRFSSERTLSVPSLSDAQLCAFSKSSAFKDVRRAPYQRTCSTPTLHDDYIVSSSPPPPYLRSSTPTLESSSPTLSKPAFFLHPSSSPRHTPPPYIVSPPFAAATATSSPKAQRRATSAVATSSPKTPRRREVLSAERSGRPSDGPPSGAAVVDTLETQVRHIDSSPCSSEQGAESTMYGHHISSRRRKKRPMGHGIKNVQVSRGRSGYGFTISGQHPCVLSCIVGGSPADLAGLKAGDYLYFVNGLNVSHAPHDDVVRMVGQSTGTLDLQVAENYNSSDSSEDDYPPRSKSRYPNRVRFRQPQQSEGVGRGGIASRPLPQRPVDVRGGPSRVYRNHVPVGAESDLSTTVTSPGSSVSEERSRHQLAESMYGWKRPVYEKIGRHSASHSKLTDSSTTDMSGDGLAFSMATVQNGPVISTAKISAASKRPPSRSQGASASQSNINAPSQGRASASSVPIGAVGGGASASNAGPNPDFADRDEDEDAMQVLVGDEAKALVGYIGSIELPGNLNRPNQRLQQLRNAVRRLRVEQKIHTLVLMQVDPSGVRLSNAMGGTIAHYTVDKLAFSGICPDDKRFFGIVTLNSVSDDVSEISGHADGSPSSSCHVFMVDPDMCSHVLHSHKAKAFNLVCTPGPGAQRCMEFPHSPTHLILCIANLYRDRPRSKLDSDIIQSHAFADPSRPAQRSSSDSSNSDSGLGNGGREEQPNDQVCVVDMQVEAAASNNNINVRARNCITPNVVPSRSLGSLHPHNLSPGVHSLVTPRGLQRPMSAFEVRRGLNNSSSSEEWMGQGRVDKLTPRAMPDPATRHLPRATSTDGLERNPSPENLRQSMQRLLQARQQQLQQEQAISSDSESQVSSSVHHRGNHDPFSARSAFQVPRPVSAPLRSRGRAQAETVDMGFGKLSPRALQQPGSVIRSPSAPPIPYFPHQDSDEDDDDTESEDDPFVRTIISQFNRDRVLDFGEENPRRYSEGYALSKQREKERAEVEETQKWTKTGSFRRSHNAKLKANISQSHESLAVADGDNGAVHHPQQQTGGRQQRQQYRGHHPQHSAGGGGGEGCWVGRGLPPLLADPVGRSIFTEFLKKEFSEENIVFWTAVDAYKQITDEEPRGTRAREIFSTHLGVQASDPVNVDSKARQLAELYLDSPTLSMFDVAQQQIFQLMRTDSYSRFLKSDLYKGHLMREMEGHNLLHPSIVSSKSAQDAKKKGKGKENDEKRRRSLLPWRQNKKSNVKETKGKGKEKEKDKEVNNNSKKGPGPGIDLSTMRKEVFNPKEAETTHTTEPVKFCRVVMPDTSTTVVCTRPGQNIRNVLGKLCDKRSLSIASVDVFLLGSDKPLDLEEDISTLGSKEVVIERRVLFRLDLPNHKSIGVKAKPNRSIRDVFKPILNKYGHRIDTCGVQLSGLSEFLDLDIPVSDLDNQRVIVIANAENAENNAAGLVPSQQAAVPSRHRRTPLLHLPSRSRGSGGKSGSLEEITNQIFEDLMKGKSELAHTFDELGVVDLERGGAKGHKNPEEHRSLGLFGLLRKESWGAKDTTKPKSKGRVTFALPRSDSKKKKAAKLAAEEQLMAEIERTHSQQLEEEEKERRSTPTPNTNNLPGFLAADCVETVDMATHLRGFDPADQLVDGEEVVDNPLLPPPDMFDDVHYMHSGSVEDDNTHLSDLEEKEEVVDHSGAAPPHSQSAAPHRQTPSRQTPSRQTPSRQTPSRALRTFTTFGTPRSKTNDGNSVRKKSASEEPKPYLAMQPVIVDSKDAKKADVIHCVSASSDLHTLGQTVSPHFEGLESFRPTSKGSVSSSASAPLVLAEESKTVGPGKEAVPETSKVQLRPIPARRKMLDSVNGPLPSPRTIQPDVTISQHSGVAAPRWGHARNVPPDVVSSRGADKTNTSRASPSRVSPNSGGLAHSSKNSTPSPTLPSSATVMISTTRQDATTRQEAATTPRYTPPPSYSQAVSHRQVATKGSPSPTYSAGTPTLTATTPTNSPPAALPSYRHSVELGAQITRIPFFRGSSPVESAGNLTARDVYRDITRSPATPDRTAGSPGLREALSARERLSNPYSSHQSSHDSVSPYRGRGALHNNSPYGASKTPGENAVNRESPIPRERSNSYGSRHTAASQPDVHAAVRMPRDNNNHYGGGRETPRETTQVSGAVSVTVTTVRNNTSPYGGGKETPRNSTQVYQSSNRNSGSWDQVNKADNAIITPRNGARDLGLSTPRNSTQVYQSSNRNSGSWDQVNKADNAIITPRNGARDSGLSTPRNSQPNGFVAHPSYSSSAARGFESPPAKTNSMHGPLSPRDPANTWLQPKDAVSPRQQNHRVEGSKASSVVVAEVHRQPYSHPQLEGSKASSVVVAEVHRQPSSHPHHWDVRPLTKLVDGPPYPEQTVTFV